jgi:hypothetical protein
MYFTGREDYFCVACPGKDVGKQLCSLFGGVSVEQTVVAAVLDALTPLRLEASIRARADLDRKRLEKRKQVELMNDNHNARSR